MAVFICILILIFLLYILSEIKFYVQEKKRKKILDEILNSKRISKDELEEKIRNYLGIKECQGNNAAIVQNKYNETFKKIEREKEQSRKLNEIIWKVQKCSIRPYFFNFRQYHNQLLDMANNYGINSPQFSNKVEELKKHIQAKEWMDYMSLYEYQGNGKT